VLTVVGITCVTITMWMIGTRKVIAQKPPEPAANPT
jgi:hypothetical protein